MSNAPFSASHPDSYYAASCQTMPSWPVLEESLEADVCIVGGGFTGINTAIELAERGFKVVLIEANRIGWGASGRNGGQLIRGVGHDLEQFRPVIGDQGILRLKQLGFDAVEIVKERIAKYAIDCDLKLGYADLANHPKQMAHLQDELQSLQQLNYAHPLKLVDAKDMASVVASEAYHGALIDYGSGHLHPLKLALAEAQVAANLGVTLYEQSKVTSIEHGAISRVRTTQGEVKARFVVLACNAYLNDLEPKLTGRVLPAGSYIIATEPLTDAQARTLIPQDLALCDQKVIVDYYRLSADKRLLFGGACHYSGRDPRNIAAYMRPKMLSVFPQLEAANIDYSWGGMIAIGANRLPQIGRLPEHPNCFYAQGYAGHGVNATHLAAHLVAEAITGQAGGDFELFAKVPHRTFPGGAALRAPLLALGMAWYRLKDLIARV